MANKFLDDNGLLYFWQKIVGKFVTKEELSNFGAGDMMKSTYDTNNNGVVDDAEKLGGQSPEYYAKKSELFSGDYEDLTNKPTNFAPSSHKHEQGDITGLDTVVSSITEIASGKCRAEVFNTEAELDEWLKNSTNTATLKVGDVFLIRAVDVPDYWWDGSAKQKLETTKVEIPYISNTEIDTIVAS